MVEVRDRCAWIIWLCTFFILIDAAHPDAAHPDDAHEAFCCFQTKDDKTYYQVYNISANCNPVEYSWNNASDFVLANYREQDFMVVSRTNTSLLLYEALDVIFKLNCMSGRPYKIHCAENCPLNNQHSIKNDGRSHMVPWIVTPIVVVIFGLTVVCCLKRVSEESHI